MEFAAFMVFGTIAYLIGNYVGFRSALNGGMSIARYTVAQMRLEIEETKRAVHRD